MAIDDGEADPPARRTDPNMRYGQMDQYKPPVEIDSPGIFGAVPPTDVSAESGVTPPRGLEYVGPLTAAPSRCGPVRRDDFGRLGID